MARPAKYRGHKLPNTNVNRCPMRGHHRWINRQVLGPEWHLAQCGRCGQVGALAQNVPRMG